MKTNIKMILVKELIENINKGIHTNDKIINKLKDDNEINNLKDRVINLYITATEESKSGNPIRWKGVESVYTTRDLWRKLNEIGVYYTVPLWKFDKTIEEIIQTRKVKQAVIDKEQMLIKQLLKK